MRVTLSDALRDFVEKQVSSGQYTDAADAFIEDLVHREAQLLDRVNQGEPLPVDQHLDRRLEALLAEAEASGDYLDVTHEDFDQVEREAPQKLHQRRTS